MKTRLPAIPLTACLTLTVLTATAATASASGQPTPAPASTAGLRLELPRPTGPNRVGRDILPLVDSSRKDPWVPESGPRRLMVSMYYPARSATGSPAPYMTTAEAASLLQRKAPGAKIPAELISGTRTYARAGAPPKQGRYPLVVLSASASRAPASPSWPRTWPAAGTSSRWSTTPTSPPALPCPTAGPSPAPRSATSPSHRRAGRRPSPRTGPRTSPSSSTS
ncbi:hypothetical protein [Nonomuraea sp. NPDC005650]|uniref:hypothetical protein n=1 Tax=Nonomuraea sp. NPDC005650 TaxID=3157045 RepID=UPI0033B7F50F